MMQIRDMYVLVILIWAMLMISSWVYFYYISTQGERALATNLEPDITFVPPPPISGDDEGDD